MKVRELGKNPISQEKPSGEDAHYEPEFEELQQEIDKLSIASATGESTDWKHVTSLCVTILSEKSKDLLVGAYLATGLLNTHGFEGFSVGVAFLADLVENFWDSMFPPKRRMRGRLNAINWWLERSEAFAKTLQEGQALPKEQLDNATKNLIRLDELLADKSDDAPSMRTLLNYLSMAPVDEPEPEPEPEPEQQQEPEEQKTEAPPQQEQAAPKPAEKKAAPPQAQAQPQAPAPQPQAVSSSSNKSEVDSTFRSAMNQLLGVADFYLQTEPSSPLSYRLRRHASWLGLAAAPPAQNGATMLPPPDSTIKSSLETLAQAGNSSALLQASEERVTEFLYWLDLSRFTATALENLGAPYKDACDAVCAETLLLVQRLSGLENLTFSDGTPFADQETRAWLKGLSLGSEGGMDSGGDPDQQAVAEAFSQARQLLKDKKPVDAVDVLRQGLAAAGSGRKRLLWRLALGRLLLLAGNAELAQSMGQAAADELQASHIEEWDPPLAAKVYELLHESSELLGTEEGAAQAKASLLRLNRLDPAAALRIFGTK